MSDRVLIDLLVSDPHLIADVLESIWEGVAISTIDNNVLEVNAAGKKILGTWKWDSDPSTWSKAFGLFRLDGTLFPTEELPMVRAFGGEKVDAIPMIVRSEEYVQDVVIDVTARPLRNKQGEVYGGVVVFRDITEKFEQEALLRRMNEELEARVVERTQDLEEINNALKLEIKERRRSEDRFRTLANDSPVGVVITDTNGRLAYQNPAFRRLLGYSDDELLRMNTADITATEDIEVSRRAIESVLSAGRVARIQKRYLKKTGEKVWCETNIAPIYGSQGQIESAIAVIQDISERKVYEQALKDSERRLRRLSNRILRVQEQERTRIAHEIHDEFGQVLTALRYDVAWMKKRLSTSNFEEIEKKLIGMEGMIQETIQGVRRMAAEFRPRMLDDLGLVAAIEWQSRTFEERTNIVTQFHCDTEDIPLNEEQRIHLFRIFQETLTNVARHSKATRVETWLRMNKGRLFLRVRDNGVGFDENKVRGESMGLVGIEERVRHLNGEVSLQSSPLKGTVIDVRIPVKKGQI